jgi:hypothetical protein
MAAAMAWERDMAALGVVILELLAPPGGHITVSNYEELFEINERAPANARWLEVCREMITADGLVTDRADKQIFHRHAAEILESWWTPLGDMFFSPRRSSLLSIVALMSPEKAAAARERLGDFMVGHLTSKLVAYDDKGERVEMTLNIAKSLNTLHAYHCSHFAWVKRLRVRTATHDSLEARMMRIREVDPANEESPWKWAPVQTDEA